MSYETLEDAIKESPSLLIARDGVVINSNTFPKVYQSETGLINPENYFNGSICRHNGKIFFACRSDQKPWFSNIRIVFCQLNENYQPIQSTERWLEVDSMLGKNHVEDPRLFVCDGELKMAYTDGYKMYLCHFDSKYNVRSCGTISNFKENGNGDGREKNWTPFDYNGKPHFIYSDNPRIILNDGGVWLSQNSLEWKWGRVSGGTPAIKWGTHYITFFHSSLTFKKPHHKRAYFAGAYIFEDSPRFNIVGVTQYPILKGVFAKEGENVVNQDVCVIFPSGVIMEEDHFAISYGFNDCETRVIKVTKSALTSIIKK